jgi:hypothetical protein
MAFKTNQAWDLSEHKRQIVFEHLSPRTTKETLEEYLSEFQLERCVISYKEGKNRNFFRIYEKKFIQFTVFEELALTLFIYF